MSHSVDGFDWDGGNSEKCAKHGVERTAIEALFRATPHVAPDPRHGSTEDRFIAVGPHPNGRPMFVAFTIRHVKGRALIRPISARYMHAKEARAYAARNPETDE